MRFFILNLRSFQSLAVDAKSGLRSKDDSPCCKLELVPNRGGSCQSKRVSRDRRTMLKGEGGKRGKGKERRMRRNDLQSHFDSRVLALKCCVVERMRESEKLRKEKNRKRFLETALSPHAQLHSLIA